MRWLLTFTLSGFAVFLVVALAVSIGIRGSKPFIPANIDSVDRHVLDIDCGRDQRVPDQFQCDDRIDQRGVDIKYRVVWWQSPQWGEKTYYAYNDGKGPLSIVTLDANPESVDDKLPDIADVLNKVLLMSLAILIIAKGRDPRLAYPAGIFLYGMAAGSGIVSTLVGLPWWLIVLVQSLRQVLLGASFFALFMLSTELAKHAYSSVVKKRLNALGAAYALAVIIILLVGSVVYPLIPYTAPKLFYSFFYGLPIVAKIMPLLIMAYALAREDAEDVSLLRWIFASTLIGFSGPLIKETSSVFDVGSRALGPLVLTESVMAFGYGYALIRSRLVDVNFVLNRAAVFAVLAGLVAIGFQLGETLLQQNYVHKNEVAYALVLLLGISLNYLRPQLETLFRRLGSAHRVSLEAGLAALIRDCRQMKSVDDIVTVTVKQLRHLMGVRACALYERQNGTLVRVALDESIPSSKPFPVQLADDDQVVLRMGETRLGVDAIAAGASLVTAMPPSSTAFPMIVSDELIGAIAVDPAGEQQMHDPDVRHDIRTFSRELGNVLAFKRSIYCESPVAPVPAASRLSPA